jgi:hypothetical protein
MENAGRAGDLEAVKARLLDIESQFGRLREAMNALAAERREMAGNPT